jgi:hypothetical protein
MGKTIAALSERLESGIANRRANNNAPTADVRQPPATSSTNNDFASVCKCIYKWVQIRHHQSNWERLPKTIEDRITKLNDDIRPPMADDEFRTSLADATKQFGDRIRNLVNHHLEKKRLETETTAGHLDPTDVDKAKDIAAKYVNARLGKRLQPSQRSDLLDHATDMIGVYRNPQPNAQPPDRISEWQTVRSPRRPNTQQPQTSGIAESARKRKQTPTNTPENIIIHNRFDAIRSEDETDRERMNDDDKDDDVEVVASPPTSATTRPSTKKLRPSQDHTRTDAGVYQFTGPKDTWSIELSADTEAIVIGDSNLRNVTRIPPHWQINSLAGARIPHVTGAISRMSGRLKQVDVIIQAGINHRHGIDSDTEQELLDLIEILRSNEAVRRFRFMAISIPATLPANEIENIRLLNRLMLDLYPEGYVGPLDDDDVHINPVDRYGIHHTSATADRIITKAYKAVTGRDF